MSEAKKRGATAAAKPEHEPFTEIVGVHHPHLLRTAYALTGDWHAAEDIVQAALVKLYRAWPLRDPGAVEAWLLHTMTRTWIDETRRPWWRRERPAETLPDHASTPGPAQVDAHLLGVLDDLPPRQRACLVLRYLEDLSLEQTAAALNCSVGTVSGYSSRGLATLRARLTPASTATTDNFSHPTVSSDQRSS